MNRRAKAYSIMEHDTEVRLRLVSQLNEKFTSTELRTDHALQRESGQHNSRVRDGIIVSCILHENFDSIKICEQFEEDGTVTMWLIDGKQRLSDIHNFIQGKFKLGTKLKKYLIRYQSFVRDAQGNIMRDDKGRQMRETKEFDLRGKSFNDLPEELKCHLLNCEIQCTVHIDCSDADVAYHIYRYNSVTPMNPNQRGILSMPEVAPYIKKLCDCDFFEECTNLTEQKGGISNILAEVLMLVNFYDHWNKNAEDRGDYLNDNFTPEMFDKLSDQLDRLYDIVDGETGELFDKHSLVLLKFFDEFCGMGLDDEVFGGFLEEFQVEFITKDVDGRSFMDVDSNRNKKDKCNLKAKLEILRSLFADYVTSQGLTIPENSATDADISESKDVETIVSSNEVNDLFTNLELAKTETVKEFVNKVADDTIDEEDMQVLEEDFDLITLDVDNDNPILEQENMKSILAVMAYSYREELDFESWFKDYAKRTKEYLFNQRENYEYMLEDLLSFNSAA